MIRRAVLGYVVLTAAWLAAGIALSPGMAYGYTVARLSIWWGLLVMLMATAYYGIQELPAALVTPAMPASEPFGLAASLTSPLGVQ